MNSVLVTADLHFSDKPRDAYRHEFVKHLIGLIHKYHVSWLYILGDLTEEKDRHSAWLVNRVVKHVRALANRCRVLILRGNHDGLDPTLPYYHFARWVEAEQSVLWVTEPMFFGSSRLGSHCLLPHTTNYEKDWAEIKKKFSRCEYIFAHNTFQGTKLPGMPAAQGIPTSIFPKGPRIISGDIHAPVRAGPVEYVGAPYLVDFGDDYDPRVLLLSKDREPKSIACPGRQKRLVIVDDLKNIESALRKHLKGHKGDIIKVRVPVTAEQHKTQWPEIKERVSEACRDLGCHLHLVQPKLPPRAGAAQEEARGTGAAKSDSEHLAEYADTMGISSRLLETGRELL